jgi:hypothetical protein
MAAAAAKFSGIEPNAQHQIDVARARDTMGFALGRARQGLQCKRAYDVR